MPMVDHKSLKAVSKFQILSELVMTYIRFERGERRWLCNAGALTDGVFTCFTRVEYL